MTVVTHVARRASGALLLVFISAFVGAELIKQPSFIRFIAAGCLGVCAVVGATQWPRVAVGVTLVLLPYLALGRRLLLEFTPWKSTDPLLLIAPIVLVLVVLRLFLIEQRPLGGDRISKLIVFLLALTFLEAFNPRGGGLSAGSAALLFTAVPLLWFFAGRELATRRALQIIFAGVVVSGCLIAAYGIAQTRDGMPSWDRMWVNQTGYSALHIGNVIRAFGTFSSSAEYAAFLGIALIVAVAFALDRRPYLLPAVPLLAYALFYESSRGIVVTTVLAVLVVLAAKTGSLRRAVIVFVVCLSALVIGLILERGALQAASTSSNPLVSHQLGGFAHPLNSNQSTLPVHFAMFKNGLKSGLFDPIGYGIASTTEADRLGNPQAVSTEVDLSNEFVAEGTFGGLAYLAVVLLVLASALRNAVARRDAVSLAALGVLVALLGQWLNGGYYALSPLIWFVIGFLVAEEGGRTFSGLGHLHAVGE